MDNPVRAKWSVSTDAYNSSPLLSSVSSSFYPNLKNKIDTNIAERLKSENRGFYLAKARTENILQEQEIKKKNSFRFYDRPSMGFGDQ